MGMSRSENMRRIRSKDTAPELMVRSLVHRLGYRFRLHRKDLPGKPDLVFPSRGKVIFVHGCFWHGHDCPSTARTPKTNTGYWVEKIRRNTERDVRHRSELNALGWDVLVVWECEIKDAEALSSRLTSFLE
jgi:DNA mismatch endonuclease (patch repair protein)